MGLFTILAKPRDTCDLLKNILKQLISKFVSIHRKGNLEKCVSISKTGGNY